MSIIVPGAKLAKAWLSVACASSADKSRPVLNKTVAIEQFPHGVRLVATDGYVLLTSWVAESEDANPGYYPAPEPELEEIPYATAVAVDQYGRAAGLLSHLLRLAKSDEADKLDLDVVVKLNVPWQPDDLPADELQLDGLMALAVSIEHPDHERLQLQVYEGDFVNWRTLIRDFKRDRPRAMAITARMAAAIGKAARVHGDATLVKMRFSQADKAVAVEFGDDPAVTGLFMPAHWDYAKGEYDTPATAPAPAEPDEVGDADLKDERDRQ